MITGRIKNRPNMHLFLYGKFAVKTGIFVVFLSALFFVLAEFKSAKYFPIAAVKVFGIHNASQKELQRALVPLVDKGFFAIDVETIKDRLLQSPWISQATVQRKWPNQVVISLTERNPIARWKESSLLSSNGELFSPRAHTYPTGLPQLIGPEGQQLQVLQHYQQLSALLEPLQRKISRLELTADLSWNLTFDNGMKLEVDHKDSLTRIGHFVKVYPQIIGTRVAEVDYIDLRYPNGLAVRWKTG